MKKQLRMVASKGIFMVLTVLLINGAVQAQGPFGPEEENPDIPTETETSVPFDDGVVFLLAAGLFYGAKKALCLLMVEM